MTEGSVLSNVLSMGVPSMIGFATTVICALADVFFVGLLGSAAVAGMTLFLAFAGVLSSTNALVGAGSVAVISRRYGENDEAGTENAIRQTLLLKFALGAASGAVGILLIRTVLCWLHAEPDAATYGLEYGFWFFVGLPLNFCSWTMFTAFRGLGDANRAMCLMILTTGLNILLDPLLMFDHLPSSLSVAGHTIIAASSTIGLGLGIKGAAIAKGLAMLVSVALGLWMLRSPGSHVDFHLLKGWKPDFDVIRRIFKIGVPPGLEGIVRTLAGAATASFIGLFGTSVVAAFGFASQILGFTLVFAVGMSLGTSAIVGHCLGRGRRQMATKTVIMATAVVLAISAASSVAVFLLAPDIMSIFTDDPVVAEKAIVVLRIVVFSQFLFSLRTVLNSAFNGSGNTMPPTVIGIVAEGVRLCVIAVSVYLFCTDETGIWWAFVMASGLDASLLFAWFRKGAWREQGV